jgi:hypothetical protein
MTTTTVESGAGTSLFQTQLIVTDVYADLINVEYSTMPGNLPNTYGNFLAIWQNANSIPWNTAPLQTFPIPTNMAYGVATFGDLNTTINSYIIGYSVGPILSGNAQEYGNICSTVYIQAASAGQDTVFMSSISNIRVGTTSVSFDFTLPDGILPQTNGAWAGLWRGTSANFYGTAPLSTVLINPDVSRGTDAFNNLSITRGTSYTIGIFMSGYKQGGGSIQKALACSAGFTT